MDGVLRQRRAEKNPLGNGIPNGPEAFPREINPNECFSIYSNRWICKKALPTCAFRFEKGVGGGVVATHWRRQPAKTRRCLLSVWRQIHQMHTHQTCTRICPAAAILPPRASFSAHDAAAVRFPGLLVEHLGLSAQVVRSVHQLVQPYPSLQHVVDGSVLTSSGAKEKKNPAASSVVSRSHLLPILEVFEKNDSRKREFPWTHQYFGRLVQVALNLGDLVGLCRILFGFDRRGRGLIKSSALCPIKLCGCDI